MPGPTNVRPFSLFARLAASSVPRGRVGGYWLPALVAGHAPGEVRAGLRWLHYGAGMSGDYVPSSAQGGAGRFSPRMLITEGSAAYWEKHLSEPPWTRFIRTPKSRRRVLKACAGARAFLQSTALSGSGFLDFDPVAACYPPRDKQTT